MKLVEVDKELAKPADLCPGIVVFHACFDKEGDMLHDR